MAAILDQLRQLHRDPHELARHDSEQEVTGRAFAVLDAVLAEARECLPPESSVRRDVEDLITPEAVGAGEVEVPRAADAAILVGQVLVALEYYEREANREFPDVAGYRPEGEPRLITIRAFVEHGGVVSDLPVVMNGCARALNVVRWRSLAGEVVLANAPFNYAEEPAPPDQLEFVQRGIEGIWQDSWCLQPVFFYAPGQTGRANLADVAVSAQFYVATP